MSQCKAQYETSNGFVYCILDSNHTGCHETSTGHLWTDETTDALETAKKCKIKINDLLEIITDMSDTAIRYGLDPDFENRGKQISIMYKALLWIYEYSTHQKSREKAAVTIAKVNAKD